MDINEIKGKFIIVYEDELQKVANSLYNKAIEKGIQSVLWSCSVYSDNKNRLNNTNHIVSLSSYVTRISLSNPNLQPQEIGNTNVFYKEEGNVCGIYPNFSYYEPSIAAIFASVLFLPFGIWYAVHSTKMHEQYFSFNQYEARLFEAIELFADSHLTEFVNN